LNNIHKWFRKLATSFPLPIFIVDDDFRILTANEKMNEICKLNLHNPQFLENHIDLNLLEDFFTFKRNLQHNFYAQVDIKFNNLGHTKMIGHRLQNGYKNLSIIMMIPLYYKEKYMQLNNNYETIMNFVSDAIIVTDSEQKIIASNTAFTRTMGYSFEEVRGRFPSILKSGKQDDDFYKNMYIKMADQGYFSGELTDRKKSGELLQIKSTIIPVCDDSGKTINYIGILQDITELKSIRSKIISSQHKDALTGIQNRESFLNILDIKCELSNAKNPIALLFIDLNKFKQVNDTYGHQYGDFVLTTAATRIQKALRSNDMLGRYGGDEFLILLERVSKETAYEVAKKVSETLSKPYIVDEQVIDFISGSIGISFCPQDGYTSAQLIEKADVAMYKAKQNSNTSSVIMSEDFHHDDKDSKSLRIELMNAIDNDEFYIRIQPIVNLQDKKVIGGEVLARWINLSFDEVMPGTFIPLAHLMGIIKKFDKHILMKTIEALDKKKLPKDFFINVNFSAEEFGNFSFVTMLENLTITHPWLKNHLVIEITESTMMANIEQTSEYLSAIKEIGLKIAIDDFGTGFSSLAYLKHFAIDYLKIDISFVENIENSKKDKDIVSTIAMLARSIGAKTIIEGIERETQYDIIKELDLDYAQGFLFDKPLLSDVFLKKIIS